MIKSVLNGVKIASVAAAIYATSFSLASADYLSEIAKIPSGNYAIEKTHASLTFKVNHIGLSFYTARFTDIKADVNLNSADVEKSSVNAEVKLKSVKTDYPFPKKENFDAEIAKKFFNAKKYPVASFVSKSIKKTGANTGVITGDLTMHGQTQTITLDAVFNGGYDAHPYTKNPAFGISAKTKIKRSQWGINEYIPYVGDEVELALELEFVKK